jgi:hypothetical protein
MGLIINQDDLGGSRFYDLDLLVYRIFWANFHPGAVLFQIS